MCHWLVECSNIYSFRFAQGCLSSIRQVSHQLNLSGAAMIANVVSVVFTREFWHNIARLVLLVLTVVAQLTMATLAYAILYGYYLPDQITTIPVYLQYGLVLPSTSHVYR